MDDNDVCFRCGFAAERHEFFDFMRKCQNENCGITWSISEDDDQDDYEYDGDTGRARINGGSFQVSSPMAWERWQR